jgi:hypothetical protein
MPKSVINCLPLEAEIIEALKQALSPEFLKSISSLKSDYGKGTATNQIMDILISMPLPSIKKSFFDLN